MVAAQARFIDNHRNIPILEVPHDAQLHPGINGKTLIDMLNAHSAVQRVAVDPAQKRYHVSTIASKYRELHEWIHQTIQENQFPYSPHVRPMKFGTAKSSNGGMSYSDIFKDAISVASDKYTTSTIKTNPTNPWKTRPPLAISYERNNSTFPPLTPLKPRDPVSPSLTSEILDEDTIQSAISVAIKKLEDQHRKELNQLKLEMQANIDEVKAQMRSMGEQVAVQTYQALVKDESPLATKTDHAHLQQEIGIISTQLETIIKMFHNGSAKNKSTRAARTPEKSLQPRDLFSQDHSVSSAASDSDEGMEGCEE